MVTRVQVWFLLLAVFVLLSSWSHTWDAFDTTGRRDGLGDEYSGGTFFRATIGSEMQDMVNNSTSLSVTLQSTPALPSLPSMNAVDVPRVALRPPRNMFDCGLDVYAPKCVYFDPSTYFDETKSPLPPHVLDSVRQYWGNKFNASTKSVQDLFWFSIQQDIGVYNLLQWNDDDARHVSPPPGWPHTLMGLHIHKCGGSSVGRTFLKISNSGNSTTNAYDVTFFYKNDLRAKFWDQHGTDDLLSNRSIALHQRLLQEVFDNQQEKSPSPPGNFVAFAFVREPLGRFLSSVREFMASRNKRRRLCLEAPNSTDVLKCIISKLQQENGLQLDQHFAPATLSLYMFSLLEPRDKIAILPLTADVMADFQATFLGPRTKTMKLKSSKPRKYNITMDALDGDMIRDICILYLMDVILLRHLGISTATCNGIV